MQAEAKPSRLSNPRGGGGRKSSLDRSQTKISSYFEPKPTTNKALKSEDPPKENIKANEPEKVQDPSIIKEKLSKKEKGKTDAESEICLGKDAGKGTEEPDPKQRKVEPEKEKRAMNELVQNFRRSGRRSEIER